MTEQLVLHGDAAITQSLVILEWIEDTSFGLFQPRLRSVNMVTCMIPTNACPHMLGQTAARD